MPNWVSLFIPPKSPFKLGSITFDAILEETHNFDSDITSYPVESGAVITDNVILKPITLSIKALSTDYPFVLLGIGGGIPLLETSKSTELFNVIFNLRNSKQTVDVVTGLRSYKSMAIQNITVPRTDSSAAIYFEITLQQILKATAQTVKIPKDQVLATVQNAKDQVPSKVNEGLQQTRQLKEGSTLVKGFENFGWVEKRYAP
jgi:hypothetical protein